MMMQSHVPALRLITIAFFGLSISLAQAETLTGQVVKIADGDTLTVLDASKQQHRIRLTGIDAPERKQAFGTVSRQHLADRVFGRVVTVEWHQRDRYQRILGKVLINGQDANLEQIRAGLAWHYSRYARNQVPGDRERYALAEDQARRAGVGLWRDAAPVPPWDFRRK
ncbi:MAG: thermonuclease family protein [Nitrosospira sp.]